MIEDVLSIFPCSEAKGQHFVNANCIEVMKQLHDESVDLFVTSPPYNLSIPYSSYDDRKDIPEYLQWCKEWMSEVKRLLKKNGSFFLNVAGSPSKPDAPFDIFLLARSAGFTLQNNITWVKSAFVPDSVRINDVKSAAHQKKYGLGLSSVESFLRQADKKGGHTFGHFKPVNSERYLNKTTEFIFHFTFGNTLIHKLDIGAEYVDSSNLTRWKSQKDKSLKKKSKRCAGEAWFIPYSTRLHKADHPAIFPVEIPMRCMLLHFGDDQRQWSKDRVIMDIFSGSGTTAIASAKLGHSAICVEIDKDYHNLAIERLQYDS